MRRAGIVMSARFADEVKVRVTFTESMGPTASGIPRPAGHFSPGQYDLFCSESKAITSPAGRRYRRMEA